MKSYLEEFKIPLLDDLLNPKQIEHLRVVILGIVSFFIWMAAIIWFVLIRIDHRKKVTHFKPEISLDSLFICPTNISNNLVIWDLKFGIKNTNNYSVLCAQRFEVSIFPYNQTKLLTMGVVPLLCIQAGGSHGSANLLIESSSLMDLNDLLDRTSGTFRLDVKINGQFDFIYYGEGDSRYPKIVCGDAKVSLSPLSNLSYCGSMVGDPFACSYQRYPAPGFSILDLIP